MDDGLRGATVQTQFGKCKCVLLIDSSASKTTFSATTDDAVCPTPLRDSSISLSSASTMKMIGSSSHAPLHRLDNIDPQSNYLEGNRIAGEVLR